MKYPRCGSRRVFAAFEPPSNSAEMPPPFGDCLMVYRKGESSKRIEMRGLAMARLHAGATGGLRQSAERDPCLLPRPRPSGGENRWPR
jgi:hypothetical protein